MRSNARMAAERALGKSGRHRLFKAAFFAAVLLPSMAVMAVSVARLHQRLTERTLERRAVIAELAGRTAQGRFEGVVELGRSLAGRVAFGEHVAAGRWDDAAQILARVPADFPYVERLFLTDAQGTLMADRPQLPGVVGQNFSERDWYRGVSAAWKPYVSEVYQRAAEPRLHVVAVAVPIRAAETEAVAGILVLQIRLDTLLSWIGGVPVGEGGGIYMTDRRGALMAHPDLGKEGELVDFSGVPTVRDAIAGTTGVSVTRNEIEESERVSATWRSPAFGFVVVAYEPASAAFASRDRETRNLLALCGLLLALELVLALVLWSLIRALFAMREKERAFLESIGDGVIAVDRGWRVILWNRAASRMTGWAASEAMGKPFREHVRFIRESDRKENLAFIEEAMLFGEVRPMVNSTVLVARDGREVPISDSAAPLFDEDGNVSGVIIIFRDATREKEEAMLRTDFAYASHQLRTPVNKALWSIEVVMDALKDKEARTTLETAYHAVRDVQKLSTRLVDVSQIDQKQIVPAYEEVSVATLIDDAIAAAHEHGKPRKAKIHASAVREDLKVDTDPRLLGVALRELIDNAVLYGSESGVEIAVQPEKLDLVIQVMDRGIGISDEQKPLIFTKFFRGQNVPQDAYGAGLGLFIARSYVRLLGGKIWFESKLGLGTTFTISVPRVRGMKE